MNRTVLFAILFFSVSGVLLAAPGDVSLAKPTVVCPQTRLGDETLQSDYDSLWKAYGENVEKATKAVGQELTRLYESAKSAGNLDLALFWSGMTKSFAETGKVKWEPANQKKEWKRFGDAEFPDGLTAVLTKCDADYDKARVVLDAGYKALEVSLTKADKLEQALAIRKESQALWSSGPSTKDKKPASVAEAVSRDRVVSRVTQLRQKTAPDAVKIDAHYYKVFPGKVSWRDAKRACEAMGGYLACLEQPAEQRQIAQLKGQGRVVWVGGRRSEQGQFTWVNGRPLDAGRVKVDDPTFGFVGFTVGADLNVRPESGTADFAVRDIQGFICEWDE